MLKLFMKSLLYFLTLIFLSMSSNWMMLFLMLELNSIMILWLLKKSFFINKIEFMIKYFLIQSMNSIILILFLLLSMTFFNMIFFILIMIFSKMGLPPLYFWMKELIKFMSFKLMMYFLILQKLPIFGILMMLNKFSFYLNLMLLSLIISVLEMWQSMSFNLMFFFSSMNNNLSMLILILMSKKMFIIYFMLYFFVMFLFILFMNMKFFMMNNIKTSVIFNLMLLFLLGLPPSPMFFMKIFLIMKSVWIFNLIISFIISMCLMIAMIIYLNWFLIFLKMVNNKMILKYKFNLLFMISYLIIFTPIIFL